MSEEEEKMTASLAHSLLANAVPWTNRKRLNGAAAVRSKTLVRVREPTLWRVGVGIGKVGLGVASCVLRDGNGSLWPHKKNGGGDC